MTMNRLPYLLIVLAGLLLYSSTVFFGLSYLDDNILILENYSFLSRLSNIAEAFRQDVFHVLHEYDAAYRPLLTISFMADVQLDKLFGFGYHLTNLLAHLAASCLVFLLFVKLKYRRSLALFFALIFEVHPVLTQAVAWIPGRNDSLLGIFIILSFIFFTEFLERGKWAHLVWHIIFFALALFTKEAALGLIPVGIVYYFAVLKNKPVSVKRRWLAAGWFLTIALWFFFRNYALSYNPAKLSISGMLGDLARGVPAIILYIGKAILPFNLSIIPVMRDTTMLYGVASILIIVAGLTLSKNKRYGFIVFGAVWFTSFLVPTFISPISVASPIFLEARMYLPILGILILLAEIDIIKNINLKNRPELLCVLAIICLFFYLSADYSVHFQDKTAFWEYAVKRSPHSSLAQYNLGSIYNAQGKLDEAEARFRKSLELNPNQRYAHNSLGRIYDRRGMVEKAEAEYGMEIKNTPYNETAYLNLADIYMRQGKSGKAEELWEAALRLNPDDTRIRKMLIAHYFKTGNFDRSLYHAREFQKRGGTVSREFLDMLEEKLI